MDWSAAFRDVQCPFFAQIEVNGVPFEVVKDDDGVSLVTNLHTKEVVFIAGEDWQVNVISAATGRALPDLDDCGGDCPECWEDASGLLARDLPVVTRSHSHLRHVLRHSEGDGVVYGRPSTWAAMRQVGHQQQRRHVKVATQQLLVGTIGPALRLPRLSLAFSEQRPKTI